MDLQDQLEIGQQAEEFLRYVDENPYFRKLIERVVLEYSARLLGLKPDQRDDFSRLKERVDVWQSEILDAIGGDIANAREALRMMEGNKQQGIL